ncbi:PA0069 family radical SAM protein [Methylomicrobium sp. Wu6]|uniref:PA0069 family radical SAM protein n=1 Tax=Methylomicrobium sp. Wu6 TaxID=3107928 RepID=UPI002DD69B6E|nr:PA0069 family radical SAM protein [Methylomicrobium sp. Wu6]MEC4748770.1 PA0069 family radical SAM protein [Methylomicrobium sp. Wu6]
MIDNDGQNPLLPPQLRKGRGALSNRSGRFEAETKEAYDDGWGSLDELPERVPTHLGIDSAKTVLSYNQSPDVPFDRSINPYRGCEHGCVYCFARPSHAYLGLSPGLDFETRLFYKPDAPELLREELRARRYRPAPVALGINTDAYQPVERRLGLTRRILEVLRETGHPVSIVTKSALIERDLDILQEMAAQSLAQVAISVTTLKAELARRLEPRAAAPKRRLQTIEQLAAADIPVSVLVAPLIPMLNDEELENILSASRKAGAVDAGYVLLRLPLELHDLFAEWLRTHAPLKAERVLHRIFEARGGKAYDSAFGTRMTGTGEYADLLGQRFRLAYKRLAFSGSPDFNLDRFRPPQAGGQTDLFW